MPTSTEGADRRPDRARRGPSASLLNRLGWFVLLWLAGVAVVGAVAYAIRSVLL